MLRLAVVFVALSALPGCYLDHRLDGAGGLDAGRRDAPGDFRDVSRPDTPIPTFDVSEDPCVGIECPAPPVACARSFCEGGFCLLEPIPGFCPFPTRCDFSIGCVGGFDAGTDAPIFVDAPRLDAPADAPRLDAPADAPRLDAPADAPRFDAPIDAPRLDAPADAPRPDAPPVDGGRPPTSRAFACTPSTVITVNDQIILSAGPEMTLETWVRARGPGFVSGKGELDGQRHLRIELVRSADGSLEIVAGWTTGTITSEVRAPFPGAGRWTHVAYVQRLAPGGVSLELWLDAVLVATTIVPDTTADAFNDLPLLFCQFDGDMDEIRYWSSARAGSLIASSRFGMVPFDSPGMIGYWPLETATQRQADRSLHGTDGFLGQTNVPDSADPTLIFDGAF